MLKGLIYYCQIKDQTLVYNWLKSFVVQVMKMLKASQWILSEIKAKY